MKRSLIETIGERLFIKRRGLFPQANIVLYHPGHFPELNKDISLLYLEEGFDEVWIPDLHNNFLQESEYTYHKTILVSQGIPENRIKPIKAQRINVEGVISQAFGEINSKNEKNNVLLAGKSFFVLRFYTLACLYSNEEINIDILPLEDSRGINMSDWNKSEKGRDRVISEIRKISEILERHNEILADTSMS